MAVLRNRSITLALVVVGLAISIVVLLAVPRGRAGSRQLGGLSGKSTQGNKIAFSSDRSGSSEIYTVYPDGSDLQQLTSGALQHFGPTWSPDGTKIAFYQTTFFPPADSPIPPGAQPSISIDVMNADGSDQRGLTPANSHDFGGFVWSPDGTRLALECSLATGDGGNGQICVLNVDGTGIQRIVPPDLLGFTPVWSPDGRWIAFRAEPAPGVMPMGIYLVSPDGKQRQIVQRDADFSDQLAWSPDGSKLAYTHGMRDKTLTVINRDGSDQHDLNIESQSLSDPSWSPRGNQLLFVSGTPDSRLFGLNVINGDGGGLRNIPTPTGQVTSAVWSPDGQEIAVILRNADASLAKLEVLRLDGSSARTVLEETVATDGDGLIAWPPSWQPGAVAPGA